MRITVDILSFEVKVIGIENGKPKFDNQVTIIHKEHGLHGVIIREPYAYLRDVRYKDGDKEQKELDMILNYIMPNYGGTMGLELKLGLDIMKYDKDGKETHKHIETTSKV